MRRSAFGIILVAILAVAASTSFTQTHQEFGGAPQDAAPTYFAEIDKSGIATGRVIVADQAFIDSGAVGSPSTWIETDPDNSKHARYPGKDYAYDIARDAFIPPKGLYETVFDEQEKKWKTDPALIQASSTTIRERELEAAKTQ